MAITITTVEANVKALVKNIDRDHFIYDLLLAYGTPKATISKIKSGEYNRSKADGEIRWQDKMFYRFVDAGDMVAQMEQIRSAWDGTERFIVLFDGTHILAFDTLKLDSLDIEAKDLLKDFAFFWALAGMEQIAVYEETDADVRAAEKMAKLYDELCQYNHIESEEDIHSMNVFLSRLLFCFFAEDTEIFKKDLFTNNIKEHTQRDGSDMQAYLGRLFDVLDTSEGKREGLPSYLCDFPYVNGGLFRQRMAIPKFTKRARLILTDTGALNWSDINPDIFGSMIQAVVTDDHRGHLGMHYTSVPNIMKLIEPLFLDALRAEFVSVREDKSKLNKLLYRIHRIKIFDPACGSGNFLIIAYKELRRLEMEMLQALALLDPQNKSLAFSGIELSHFYGIELDDFAHEVAVLALWLAEHQMNVEFYKAIGRHIATLPLSEAGQVRHGNALLLDWDEVCPRKSDEEIYMIGNPPYLGSSMQTTDQKAELADVFHEFKNYKNLDYIACWFKKGVDYIEGYPISFAFVTTNSICQGEQVGYFWPYVFAHQCEIGFAYQSFKWQNNAKAQAGVTVAIIGVRNVSKNFKFLFTRGVKQKVENINGYLIASDNIVLQKVGKPISDLLKMVKGNQPTDGGNLILSSEERVGLIKEYPEIEKYIYQYIGSQEFIRGENRYCLWIRDHEVDNALNIAPIKDRVDQVLQFRSESRAKSTREFCKGAHRFIQIQSHPTESIIIPSVSSERRDYIPMGFLGDDTVVSNLAFAIYDAAPWMLSVLMSRMHMVWVRAVSGYLGTSIRYSNSLSYNTFPFPSIGVARKEMLNEMAMEILDVRDRYPSKTMAELYDPDKMPDDLRAVHAKNDEMIDMLYRKTAFDHDEERLAFLFRMYEKMTS
ncbi:class I SAM-dependent DNA methyltransferase [Prolixibacteraceae bacterium]|nr:class I SAM-dependent DNA methyltransferase [Prolixibacteraceae bacterium]